MKSLYLLLLSCSLTQAAAVHAVLGNGDFGTLDLTTAVFTLQGNVGVQPAGLAESGGGLYTAPYQGNGIYSVNRNTGAATLVSTATPGPNFYAIGSSTAGFFGTDGFAVNTLSVNPTTGAVTTIGPLSVTTAGLISTFSNGGSTLYWANAGDLYSINTGTGAAVLIGATGLTGDAIQGWYALVFAGNALYGIHDNPAAGGNALYSLNTSTGAATLVAAVSGHPTTIYGLAPLADVPEPATVAFMAVGLGLLAVLRRTGKY